MDDHNIKNNIVFIEKGMASVICFRRGVLEFIKKNGECEFPVSVDFWEWWQRAVSYIPGDEVDFCFIYDKKYDLLQDDFLSKLKQVPPEESMWNIEYVKNYFSRLKPTYFAVCLLGPDGREHSLCGNRTDAANVKRFRTNIDFSVRASSHSSLGEAEAIEAEEISEDEISPIARFFIDLLRKERNEV